MKKILSLVLALGMIFSLAACSGGSESGGSTAADDGQIYEFKLSIMNADQPFMEDFPALVEEKTGGRIQITLYDMSSLGTAADALAMTRNGTVEMYFNAAAQTAGEFPVADIVQVPFLASNPSTVSEIIYSLYYEGYLDEFNNETVPLMFAPTDMQMLAVKNSKIESMGSFNGLKLRAVSGIAVDMLESFGSSAVAMPMSDVYLSLDRGIVDGAMTSPHLMQVNALYDVLDYIMEYPVHGGLLFLAMNEDAYNSLPDSLKLSLMEACEEQRYRVINKVQQTYSDGIEACVAGGMELYSITPEFQQELQDAVAPLREQFVTGLNSAGHDGTAITDLTERVIERCEYNLK